MDRSSKAGCRALPCAVAVLFAMSLMSKPMSITLPLLLLLLDYWPLRRLTEKRAAAQTRAGTDAAVCLAEPEDSATSSGQKDVAFAKSTHSLWQLCREKFPLLLGRQRHHHALRAALRRSRPNPRRPLPQSSPLKNVIVCYTLYIQNLLAFASGRSLSLSSTARPAAMARSSLAALPSSSQSPGISNTAAIATRSRLALVSRLHDPHDWPDPGRQPTIADRYAYCP